MEKTERKLTGALRTIADYRETTLAIILMMICVLLTLATDSFFTDGNLFNVLKQATLVAIIAVGQTFIITSGGIDLSVGQSMALSSIISAYSLKAGYPLIFCVLLGVMISVFVGFANGVLITKLKLPAFIITLGMTNIVKGVILILTEGNIVSISNETVIFIGQGNVGPIPAMVLIMLAIVILCTVLLNKSVFGNQVKSVGGNETAARLSGISCDKVRILVYVLTGILCGIAAIIVTGRVNGGNPNSAGTYDMDSIAAVIVGGTSLTGGSGTIIGTVLGALLMILIRNGLVLLRVNIYWQTVAVGMVIIVVCAIDAFTRSRKE